MSGILAVVDRPDRAQAVLDVAAAYAPLVGGPVEVYATPRAAASVSRRLRPGSTLHALRERTVEAVVEASEHHAANLVAIPAPALEAGEWASRLLPATVARVLAVPESVGHHRVTGPARVLAPFDGTPEAAAAVTEAIDLFATPGAEVIVLHVFEEGTAPLFWDQPVHASDAWGREFLTRHGRHPGSHLELRSGTPVDEVLDVAHAEHADVIALGCCGEFDSGRARLVRRVLHDAEVPVLLVHVTRRPASTTTR